MLKYLCLFSILARLSPTSGSSIQGSLHSVGNVPQSLTVTLQSGESLSLQLRRVVGFLSPHFSLVIRDSHHVTRNSSTAHPSCLYRGDSQASNVHVSVSTCVRDNVSAVVIIDNVPHNLQLSTRRRREAEWGTSSEETLQLEALTDLTHEAECGLNQRNLAKLMVTDSPVLRLRRQTGDTRRSRRSAGERVIELGLFVDNEMYNNNKQGTEAETVARIQDIVFTYLNAVQLIYQSDKLSHRIRLVVVRLEIMKDQPNDLSTSDGNIEAYLENFCRWQKTENPGDVFTGDRDSSDHWDHALLLTGLNLYDVRPSQDSVIGLAWVSGMCHPDYSCTINEGQNYESVYVIAHEMGHNLGMVHDGETHEGNNCSPDSHLMSPVLGPGKVSWSTCSDSELSNFLNGPNYKDQANCLNDIPAIMDRFDFNSEEKLPGEKVSAMDQCVQSFGDRFRPYLNSQSPFDDLCRELWCSNATHALRAHPALEGTDCSSKPYPYGSECREGQCVPYTPDVDEQENEIPGASGETQPVVESVPPANNRPDYLDEENGIDDTPSWYDPIYNRIFTDLRNKFKEMNPVLMMNPKKYNGVLSTKSMRREGGNETDGGGVWHVEVSDCPVECGGGWSRVESSCETETGRAVPESLCDQARRPSVNRLPCATHPCP